MRNAIVSNLLLVTLAGTAVAQPVARRLVDDADILKVLHSEQSGPSAIRWASMHRLDDLDADGVDEVLLTHVAQWPAPGPLVDVFRASVISPRLGTVVFVLPPDEAETVRLAHTAAVMIEDINGDGVRDIAAARGLAAGIGLRVHSGATGELLRAPFLEDSRFAWGFSLLPWEDIDGDGQADLIASNIGNQQGAYAYISWSPGTDTAAYFIPEGYQPNGGNIQAGRAMLDLGVGASGAREFLGTLGVVNSVSQPQGAVHFFGGEPVSITGVFYPTTTTYDGLVDGGVVRLGDLNGDGHRELVTTGRLALPETPQVFGLPVLSGAIPSSPSLHILNAIAVHSPRIIVDIDGAPTTIEPVANQTVLPLGDATGDGFPDYALVSATERFLAPGVYEHSEHIVAVCGRTGQAYFAGTLRRAEGDPVQEQINSFVIAGQIPRVRDSVISPGDLNDDGAPDLLVLIVREDYGDGSEDPIREQLLLTHYLPTACVGDVDFDRVVSFADLNAVLSNFGAQDITLPADLDASGVVDFVDLNLVLSAFGQACD